ncbi:hypothetical protein Tco_1177118, partial [Tanacetum coccineum]
LAVGEDELSPISYLRPRAIHILFRGGKQTLGLSVLWKVEGRSKGGDDVGTGIGRSGGVPDRGVPDSSGWEVDGDSALNRIIAALYPKG